MKQLLSELWLCFTYSILPSMATVFLLFGIWMTNNYFHDWYSTKWVLGTGIFFVGFSFITMIYYFMVFFHTNNATKEVGK